VSFGEIFGHGQPPRLEDQLGQFVVGNMFDVHHNPTELAGGELNLEHARTFGNERERSAW